MQTQASSYDVDALEAERAKMMMFKNELPLSIQLVSQAIDSCKRRLLILASSGDDDIFQQVHPCDSLSEETTSNDSDDVGVARHALEFIPIKKSSSDVSSSSDSKSVEIDQGSDHNKDDDNPLGKKSDWLSSAQLWNMSPDLPSNSEDLVDKCKSLDDKKFDNEEKSSTHKQSESSSAESLKSGGCKKEDKEGRSKRKQRRCWSQDLHMRFLNSLKQLGGAHVATPKQIRELMKLDGLTNDEVKSHLQKYRLHTRRPATPTSQSINVQASPAQPQFVVVGSIWAPHSDYTAMTH